MLLLTLTELAPCSEIVHVENTNYGGGGIRNCGWLRRDRVCNNWLCAWNRNCGRLMGQVQQAEAPQLRSTPGPQLGAELSLPTHIRSPPPQ